MDKAIFHNMKPWPDGNGGEGVIETVSASIQEYDISNHAVLESIELKELDQYPCLIFNFFGSSYQKGDLLNLSAPSRFKLVFYKINILDALPKELRLIQNIRDCDFVYYFDENNDESHFEWYGSSDSSQPDPQIKFTAKSVEFFAPISFKKL